MRKSVAALSVAVGFVFFAGIILSVQPDKIAEAAPSTDPATLIMNILWRVRVNSYDYMTTNNRAERTRWPSDGAIFYVPADSVPGTQPLYRLVSTSETDHMDDEEASVPGFRLESTSGYPWCCSSTQQGLSQILRLLNPANGDHAIAKSGETIPGWTSTEYLSKWGFPRYNHLSESIQSLSAGGVTIQSNDVAGGSIWRWIWNGNQFVNIADHGRQIQVSFHYTNSHNQDIETNEAGDYISSQNIVPEDRHGSPLIYSSSNGTTLSTRAIPLIWLPQLYGGGYSNPVLFKEARVGKEITLNYNNMGPVALFVTHLDLATTITSDAILEVPTGYLRGNMNRYYTYNAVTQTTNEVYPSCQDGEAFATPYGGVIISDSDQANAMGVYGVSTSMGPPWGSVSHFALWNFICGSTRRGETDDPSSKWGANHHRANGFPAGSYTYYSWIVSGSLTQVRQLMNQLYLVTAPTPTPVPTSTRTPTYTPTSTYTATPTIVCTCTPEPQSTATPTLLATHTPNPTDTPDISPTPIRIVTLTPYGTPGGGCSGGFFADVCPSDYFFEAVAYLSSRGIITGYADGSFRPNNNTTRGQLCKIVVIAQGWPLVCPQTPHFTDVSPSSVFYCFVETAYAQRIISGYGDNTFQPNSNVTRAQLCKIIVQAKGWTHDTAGGPHFSDVPPIDPFYNVIETAYHRGIISGYIDSSFLPNNGATRGQISKIVHLAITQP